MAPRIIVTNGPNRGLAIEVSAEPITVGHHESRELPLKDDRISRLHARIERRGDKVILTDLGSTNGTFVNGAFIKTAVLHDGDIIVMGKTSLQFEDVKAPALSQSTAEQDEFATLNIASQDTTELLGETVLLDDYAQNARLAESVSASGQTCDVVSVVREALSDAEEMARHRHVALNFEAPVALQAKADPSLVYRLLTTILLGSLEAVGKGASARMLRVSVKSIGHSGVCVSLAADDSKGLRTALKRVVDEGLLEADVSALKKAGGGLVRQHDDAPGEEVVAISLPEFAK